MNKITNRTAKVLLAILFSISFKLAAQQPTVSTTSPSNVTYRTTMTINGSEFVAGSTTVQLFQNGQSGATTSPLAVTVNSANQITVVMPAMAATGGNPVTKYLRVVKTVSGNATASSVIPYTFTPPSATPAVSTVNRIITDFNGYWASGNGTDGYATSKVQPDQQHSLMAFRYNGVLYSTGNDAEITSVLSNSATGAYTTGNWRAIPINNISGNVPNGQSVYAVLASKIDGNANAAVFPSPSVNGLTARNVLIDGTRGLGLGTGLTNLPSTSPLSFEAGNILSGKAGDAEPDILVTQIAEPTQSQFTTYCFVDANGNIVGNPIEIKMSAIEKLGTYRSDFFTLTPNVSFNTAVTNGVGNPGGPTRDIRILAYKLSDFGITEANKAKVVQFKVLTNGTDDMAFMAYNRNTFTIPSPEISKQPVSQAVCPGNTATFSISLASMSTGTEAVTYEWQKNGVALVNGATGNGSTIVGANTANLKINNVTGADAGIYRCLVNNNTGAALSNPAYLNSVLLSATTGTTTTCQDNATTLSASAEGNNPQYQWYVTANNGTSNSTANGVKITTNGNSATYSPPVNVSGTKNYYVEIYPSGSPCAATKSDIMPVIVSTTPVAGGITPNQTICSGNSATIQVTASGDIQWQVSTDNNTWNNIASATSEYYTTDALTATRYYRAIVSSGNCASVPSNVTKVTVTPLAAGGTLSSGQTLCTNYLPSPISLTGYTGSIVRWERSFSTDFTAPTVINSTAATLSSAEMGTISQPTYFRAIVQSGNCGTVPSNYVIMRNNSTTWNGTSWNNGAPTINDAVIFTGSYTAKASFSACTVTVKNNAVVSIPTGFTVTVDGFVNVDSGIFTFEDNAALVQLTDAVNIGNIVKHKKSNPLYRFDYTMWTSPVTNQNIYNFSPATASDRYYEYKFGLNTAGKPFEGYYRVNAESTDFAAAKGYLIRMPNLDPATGYNDGNNAMQYDGVFTGVPNNGNISIPLSVENMRYTAVGNPYPSPISVRDFLLDAENAEVLDITTGIYLWRKKNNTNVSSYATLSLGGYVSNPVVGGGAEQAIYYTSSPSNWVISEAQGFIVKTKAGASAPLLKFKNSMRRSSPGSSQAFFKQAKDGASRLWLNVHSAADANAATQTAISYMEEGTLGLDYGYDSRKLTDAGNVNLYTKVDDMPLAIQVRPEFNATDVVALGFTAPTAGSYTISIDHTEGVFSKGQNIYLRDNNEGVIRNLSKGDYIFTSDAGTFETRFDVIYSTTTLDTDNPVATANNVVVFKQGSTIGINSGSILMESVTVYDINGRKLYSKNAINSTETTISNLNVAQQVLILEINTAKGKVSKRIIY